MMLRSAAVLLSLPRIAALSEQERARPNLLFILTDQQRFDAFGRAQDDLAVPSRGRVRTPHMDRLSRGGAYFRIAYTHCAVCAPARTSLLTGRTVENTGVRTNWVAKEKNMAERGNDAKWKIPALRTYDEILAEDFGYAAEYYGKWHAPYSKGYVYDNVVRAAGTARAWFGRYEADNETKVDQLGMEWEYRRWLEDRGIPRPDRLAEGTQRSSLSSRPYRTDPLDARHGMNPGADGGAGDAHGVDLVGDGNSITARQGAEALEALDRLGRSDAPFTLHVSFHMPHPPWIATERYHSMYDPDDMDTPASLGDDMSNSAYKNKRLSEGSGYLDLDKLRRWKATYYGTVTEVDEWLGLLLSKLDELGIANNTLVALSSDHGEMMGAHGMKSKNVFYEESSRVPLALRFPGRIPMGAVVEEPVTLLDLHATFLDYLGVAGGAGKGDQRQNYESDGSSLRRHIENADEEDPFVVTMWNYTDSTKGGRPTTSPAFMVRKGQWKLVVPNAAASKTLEMLFDLENDPYEMNNLVGKDGLSASEAVIGKAEHLSALLARYLIQTGHPAAKEEGQRQRRWQSLDLWVGDTTVIFRNILSGRTRNEWLYLGRSVDGEIVVREVVVEGPYADRYSLDWTGGAIQGIGYQVITITYTEPQSGDCLVSTESSSTRLVIRYYADGGGENAVVLVGPNGCKSESSTTTVPFNTPSPTSAPTAGPTAQNSPPQTTEPTAEPTSASTHALTSTPEKTGTFSPVGSTSTLSPTAIPSVNSTVADPAPTEAPVVKTTKPSPGTSTLSPTVIPSVDSTVADPAPTEAPVVKTTKPSPEKTGPITTDSAPTEAPVVKTTKPSPEKAGPMTTDPPPTVTGLPASKATAQSLEQSSVAPIDAKTFLVNILCLLIVTSLLWFRC